MREESDTGDAAVAEIASRQHGIVTAAQLREVGIDKSAATRRHSAGRLHRLHRGVYTVGHRAPSHHARWMAAVLACGEDAVLSHHSAAALWELLRPLDGPVHVSVPTTAGLKPRRGIHIHRCPSLSDPLTTRRHNIPVTTIQRTIDDLEGTVPPDLLRRARRQAELKRVRLEGSDGRRLRSGLEEDFLALFVEHRLPPVETNVKLGRWEVDFLWRRQRLVVETDCFTYHRGAIAFEDDHARELDLHQLGFKVLRFTDKQLEDEPERVVAIVSHALR
jgi:very-short-patch-repair endonuclease